MAKPVPPDMLKLAKETQALLTNVVANMQQFADSGMQLNFNIGPGADSRLKLTKFEVMAPIDLNQGTN